MRRKGEIWWSNEIIRATEENRLLLFRQEIMPVTDNPAGLGQHYEILIRMLDEYAGLV